MPLISAAVLLFLVLDPVGNIPLFVTALSSVDPSRRRRIIVRENFIALGILVTFLFAGDSLLYALRLSEPAIGIAGGIILFLIAVRMIFFNQSSVFGVADAGEPLVVPLAIPYIAGPSALSMVLLLNAQDAQRWPEWLIAVISAWAASGAILLAANRLSRMMSRRGLVAIEHFMGMLLTVIAVQMLINGINLFVVEL